MNKTHREQVVVPRLAGCCQDCGRAPKIEMSHVNETVCISVVPHPECLHAAARFNLWPVAGRSVMAEPAAENPDFASVSSEGFDVACDVVERLKMYPAPEWGRGRNGQVTLDWPSINLTVEVSSRATVLYAWTESEDAGISGGGYWETATANIGAILSRVTTVAAS